MTDLRSSTDVDPARAALEEARDAVGSWRALGEKLGMTGQAVGKWDRVPGDRVVEVETATGVPRERLRPDLYRAAPDQSP